jgi:hypothetical protein
MACMTKLCDEPSLDELLSDPVTQAVMQADRVDPTKLEAMLRALATVAACRHADAMQNFPFCMAL